jgi:hypothetical protein
LSDAVGNEISYSESDLDALGFPTELEVEDGPQDSTPPVLVEFDFTPKTIDVSSTTQWVTATLRITDDLSGSRQPYVRFISPSGQQDSFAWGDVVSGPPENRTYDASLTFPAFSETGTWQISYIRLSDAVGNEISYSESDLDALEFPTELVVVADTDGDGIPDDDDACPSSDLSGTVIIDGRNTGVENVLLVDGCTISDLISECADEADNHGEFVSAVSHTTNTLKEEGIISGKDKGMIQKGATKAAIP